MMNQTLTLPPRSTFVVALESALAIFFMFLTLCGNLTVCAAISRNKILRTVPNFLLVNLAIADIFSAMISFPLFVSVLVNGAWIFHQAVCQFQAFQSYASYSCSLLTLSVTSITRYYATVHPVKHRANFKVKTVSLIIAIIWVASLLFASAPFLGWGRYEFAPLYALCIHNHDFSSAYNTFLFFFLVVNSTIIVTCYSKIFRAMKTRQRRVHLLFAQGSSSRQVELINRQEVKLTNTVFIVICLFVLCYLPTIILGVLMYTGAKVRRFACMLSSFSVGFTSVVNPIVYWVRSRAFRDALRLLRKKEFAGQDSARMDVSDDNVLELSTTTKRQVNRRRRSTVQDMEVKYT